MLHLGHAYACIAYHLAAPPVVWHRLSVQAFRCKFAALLAASLPPVSVPCLARLKMAMALLAARHCD
jgi:hypothetical protein